MTERVPTPPCCCWCCSCCRCCCSLPLLFFFLLFEENRPVQNKIATATIPKVAAEPIRIHLVVPNVRSPPLLLLRLIAFAFVVAIFTRSTSTTAFVGLWDGIFVAVGAAEGEGDPWWSVVGSNDCEGNDSVGVPLGAAPLLLVSTSTTAFVVLRDDTDTFVVVRAAEGEGCLGWFVVGSNDCEGNHSVGLPLGAVLLLLSLSLLLLL